MGIQCVLLPQIWNKNLVMDSFMGQTIVPVGEGDVIKEERDLTGKGNKIGDPMPGKVYIEVETSDDLLKL